VQRLAVTVKPVYRTLIGPSGQTSINVLEHVLAVFKREDEHAHNPEDVLEKIKNKRFATCLPASPQLSQPLQSQPRPSRLVVLIKSQIVVRIGLEIINLNVPVSLFGHFVKEHAEVVHQIQEHQLFHQSQVHGVSGQLVLVHASTDFIEIVPEHVLGVIAKML